VPLDVDAAPVRGVWVRVARSGGEPLPRRNPPPNNRWQRGEVVDALYLADEEATTWAEWYRHLAEHAAPPDSWLPAYLWRWKIVVEAADLSDKDRLRRVGLALPTPGRAEWSAFQEIGEELWRQGWPGLLAPSAARRRGKVLCLFRDSASVRGATPLPDPRKITRAPPPPRGMST